MPPADRTPGLKQCHYFILAILERDDELAILEDGHSSAELGILFECNAHLSHRMRMTGISRGGNHYTVCSGRYLNTESRLPFRITR